jgi:hypothetical protein
MGQEHLPRVQSNEEYLRITFGRLALALLAIASIVASFWLGRAVENGRLTDPGELQSSDYVVKQPASVYPETEVAELLRCSAPSAVREKLATKDLWNCASVFTSLAMNRPAYRKEFAQLSDDYYLLALASSRSEEDRQWISETRSDSKQKLADSAKE